MKESGKNYLLTIYRLQQTGITVHSIDVAMALDFSKPSVSRAMGLLKDAQFIEIAKGGAITLTKTGLKTAKELEERTDVLTKFLLMTADTDTETAVVDAGKMAFTIQDATYKGICKFIKEVEG
ncbi:MAG: metal-dependent transcriptional regulator [Lachnospiraceae bacterium]|nr:metal-dependent transcriptional regulator [Lachnospiraceae bacterium]